MFSKLVTTCGQSSVFVAWGIIPDHDLMLLRCFWAMAPVHTSLLHNTHAATLVVVETQCKLSSPTLCFSKQSWCSCIVFYCLALFASLIQKQRCSLLRIRLSFLWTSFNQVWEPQTSMALAWRCLERDVCWDKKKTLRQEWDYAEHCESSTDMHYDNSTASKNLFYHCLT